MGTHRRLAELARRYHWRVLAASILALGSVAAVPVGIPILIPELRVRFGLSFTEVGVLLASLEIGMCMTLVVWGEVADRLRERTVLSVGLLGAGTATIAAASSPSAIWLLVALVGCGWFAAAVVIAGPRLILGLFPLPRQATALALRQTAVPISGALVAIALPGIAAAAGASLALLLLSVPMFVGAAMAMRWLSGDGVVPSRSRSSSPHPVRDPRIWRLSLAGGALFAGQVILIGFAPVYLTEVQRLPLALAGGVVAAMLVGGAVIQVAIGRWSDRRGERRRPLRSIAWGLAIGFALLSLLGDAGPAWLVAGLVVVTGAISFSLLPLLTVAISELVDRLRHGAAIGALQTLLAIPAAVVPIAFGWSVENGSWAVTFAATALVMLAGRAGFD